MLESLKLLLLVALPRTQALQGLGLEVYGL